MAGAPHIVKKPRPGKPVRWYVYAWRGGPCIHQCEGSRPRLTPELLDAIAEARRARPKPSDETIRSLIADYRASPEWTGLSAWTQTSWSTWHDRITTKFGTARLGAFNDRRIRGDILEWRDKWAHQPRAADMGVQVISRLLSWAVDRGRLDVNVAAGIADLYHANRSEEIWLDEHFAAIRPHATVEVMEGIELAAATGLRRGDLVALPWSAIGEHAIVWEPSKSRRRKARIYIPLLPETKKLLARIRARHEAEMASRKPARRKPLPATVLSNSRWRPWTAFGFGCQFNKAKVASGVELNLHDLRGTFATRCMIAELTDRQIADILGWSEKDVAKLRLRYVDQARVVVAIGARLAAARLQAPAK